MNFPYRHNLKKLYFLTQFTINNNPYNFSLTPEIYLKIQKVVTNVLTLN